MNRIAVFYDGHYFRLINAYYQNTRRKYIDFSAFHAFIGQQIDGIVSEAHFYKGRLRSDESTEKDFVAQRVFEEVLAKSGIHAHYMDLNWKSEKGIDVSLALDAYERALKGAVSIIAVITGDSDHIPLVRKVKYTGAKTMLLYWNLGATIRTSRNLIAEVDHAVSMDVLLDTPKVSKRILRSMDEPKETGVIQNLLEGFGFITPQLGGRNLYFHRSDVQNYKFDDLSEGMRVLYRTGENDRGMCARDIHVRM
jgi:cold shock CspA family protein/uncharacterized LabA/DUF88 family protein